MYTRTVAATNLNREEMPVMLNCHDHIAPILGVSDKHARDLCREGHIAGAIKVGSVWRVPRDKFLSQFGI